MIGGTPTSANNTTQTIGSGLQLFEATRSRGSSPAAPHDEQTPSRIDAYYGGCDGITRGSRLCGAVENRSAGGGKVVLVEQFDRL